MKCVLHIGTEKTGTTLLQHWLYENQKALREQGVCLFDFYQNNRRIPAYFHGGLDDWAKEKKIKTLKEKQRFFRGFLQQLETEFAQASNNADVFVISSEHLHSRLRTHEEVFPLYEFLSKNFEATKVVCYFRNQFDVAVSLYSTVLKFGDTATLEHFIEGATPENYYYNYKKIADLWSGIFGKDFCDFRIYDPDRFIANDIRRDFLSCIDREFNHALLDYTLESKNESLTPLQAAAIRQINKAIPYWNQDELGINPMNPRAKERFRSIPELGVGKIQSPSRQAIQARFRESNGAFFRTYFACENQFYIPDSFTQEKKTFELEEVETIVSELLEKTFSFFGEYPVSSSHSSSYAKLVRKAASITRRFKKKLVRELS